jgi:hypothetical protein
MNFLAEYVSLIVHASHTTSDEGATKLKASSHQRTYSLASEIVEDGLKR